MAERDGNDVDRPIQNDPDPARLHRVEVLRSEFTGQIYADWPIDRRIDAYLLHHGLTELLNDGSAYDALLECVMANVGPALRNGVLPPPNTSEHHGGHPRSTIAESDPIGLAELLDRHPPSRFVEGRGTATQTW